MKVYDKEFVVYSDGKYLFFCPVMKTIGGELIQIRRYSNDEFLFLKSKIGKALKSQKEFVFTTFAQVSKFVSDKGQSTLKDYAHLLNDFEELSDKKCYICREEFDKLFTVCEEETGNSDACVAVMTMCKDCLKKYKKEVSEIEGLEAY